MEKTNCLHRKIAKVNAEYYIMPSVLETVCQTSEESGDRFVLRQKDACSHLARSTTQYLDHHVPENLEPEHR